MQLFFNTLTSLSFFHILWLFYGAFVLHEMEEWNINDFEHRNFIGAPAASTHRSARIWIGFILLVALGWFIAATIMRDETLAAYITLPGITLAMANAAQHVFWTLYFKQYAPGVISALVLLLPMGSFIYAFSLQHGYVTPWYAITCGLAGSLLLIQTMKAGREMVPAVKALNRLGIRLSERMR